MTRPRLHLAIRAEAGRDFVPFLRRHLPRAHALVRAPLCELSLALVGDARMSQLHRQFLRIDGPTDVLSFAIDVDARGSPLGGEVVVCVGEARRRAGRSKPAMARELLLYAIHGMLHLSGFDDRNPHQYRTMHRKEDTILRLLGIGPVFSPDTARKDRKRTPRRAAASHRVAGRRRGRVSGSA